MGLLRYSLFPGLPPLNIHYPRKYLSVWVMNWRAHTLLYSRLYVFVLVVDSWHLGYKARPESISYQFLRHRYHER